MRVLASTRRAGSVAFVETIASSTSGAATRRYACAAFTGRDRRAGRGQRPRVADVDLFAVDRGRIVYGPRIGSRPLGLAFVCGRRIAGVPASALAHRASLDVPPDTLVAAWMDAHRRRCSRCIAWWTCWLSRRTARRSRPTAGRRSRRWRGGRSASAVPLCSWVTARSCATTSHAPSFGGRLSRRRSRGRRRDARGGTRPSIAGIHPLRRRPDAGSREALRLAGRSRG